jgi:hypothetical protein
VHPRVARTRVVARGIGVGDARRHQRASATNAFGVEVRLVFVDAGLVLELLGWPAAVMLTDVTSRAEAGRRQRFPKMPVFSVVVLWDRNRKDRERSQIGRNVLSAAIVRTIDTSPSNMDPRNQPLPGLTTTRNDVDRPLAGKCRQFFSAQ